MLYSMQQRARAFSMNLLEFSVPRARLMFLLCSPALPGK